MLPAVLLLLAKATLVLVAALALTRVLQRAPAGARHLVWVAALGGLLVVPALGTWAPLRLAVLPALPGAEPALAAAPAPAAVPNERPAPAWPAAGAEPAPAPAPAPGVAAGDAAWPAPAAAPAAAPLGERLMALVPAALALWGAVALAIGAALAKAWLAVRRLVRRAQPLDTADWQAPLYEVADRLGLEEPPRLLRSADAKMPFACGLRRPTIVLPAESDAWTLERRQAVLLHELAHVRRRDLAGHTLARLVCAVYWFHPLVWTAAKRLRAESERACDDLALASGARASDYAEHLLEIVTSVRRDATPSVALAMARRTEFEGRMLDILDPERPRAAPSRRQAAALVGAFALLTVIVGAAAPAPATAADAAWGGLAGAGGDAAAQDPVRPRRAAERAAERAEARAERRADEREAREEARQELAEARAEARADRAEARAEADADDADDRDDDLDATVEHVTQTVVERAVSRAAGAIEMVGPNGAAMRINVAPAVDVPVVTRPAAPSPAPNPSPAPAVRRDGFGASFSARFGAGARARGGENPDERTALLARVLRADTSASLRRVAAWGLAEYVDRPAAANALVAALRADADGAVREMAAWALADANRGTAGARDALVAAMRDADPRVRSTAIWALGTLGDRSAADALVAALGDRSGEVRARAAGAVGSLEPRQAPRPLVALLGDGEPRVRKLAAWALYSIEDPATVPALQAALRAERDPELQTAYVRALAVMGDESVDALRTLLDSNDPRVKGAAVRALAGGRAGESWPWPWPQPRPFP